MATSYIELEKNLLTGITPQPLSFDASQPINTFLTFNFMYVASITLIIAAAAVMYIIAGGWRIEASERGIRKSNETFKRVTLGLIGVLSLFTILYTVNKDLLRGDVKLKELKASMAGTRGSLTAIVPTTSSVPTSCDAPQSVAAKLASLEGLCGGATCSALSGCDYQQYLPIIRSEVARNPGVDLGLVVTIMCKETKGKINPDGNKNPNGTYDCGLMQVNQLGPCTPDSLDPAKNIAAGIVKIKDAQGSAKQIYTGIPVSAMIAAAYNSGPGYNSASVDCNSDSGFPFTPPKWVCPINPGDSKFNMCAVKAYSCDVAACVKQLGL